MIETILILSKIGSLIFSKTYTEEESDIQEKSNKIFNLVAQNKDSNIIYDYKYGDLTNNKKVYFKFYYSLYFIFICDELENELATLDFITVMMSVLDEVLKGISDESLNMNLEKVHLLVDEMVTGGIVIETNKNEIIKNYQEIMSKN